MTEPACGPIIYVDACLTSAQAADLKRTWKGVVAGDLRPSDVGRHVTIEHNGVTITTVLAGLSHSSYGARGVMLSLGSLGGWMLHETFPLDTPVAFAPTSQENQA
jgi:hypothetical protein